MEQTTSDSSTTTNEAATGEATPFPVSGQAAGATGSGAADEARDHDPSAAAAAAPAAHRLLDRVTQRAHEAVDGVSSRISSTLDGLQGGVSSVGDTRDEWLESAREAVRQHPFAAIGGAVLVGLALHSLMSSRER
jgi:ElaB/YqjD/DUF883 family membrane-anchored ribosome-binding protein